MSVIVVNGMVSNGNGNFNPGDIILGLSDRDEQELVMCGACRYVENGVQDELEEEKKPEIEENGLVKLSGGFYQLPNGEKVRGKKNALEALAELKHYSDGEEPDDDGSDDEGEGPNTELPIE